MAKKTATRIVKEATSSKSDDYDTIGFLNGVEAEEIKGLLESQNKLVIYPHGKKATGETISIGDKEIPEWKMHKDLPPYLELKGQYAKLKISALDLVHITEMAKKSDTFQEILKTDKEDFKKQQIVDVDSY